MICTTSGICSTRPFTGRRVESESFSPPTEKEKNACELQLFVPNPEHRAIMEPNIDQNGELNGSQLRRRYSMTATMLEMNREYIKQTNQTGKKQKTIIEYSLLRRTASI